jgi:hypothetical protein
VVSDITPVSSQHLIGRHANGSGDAQEVTVSGGLEFSGSGIQIADTAVTAAEYTAPTITVDSKGRITAAESVTYETPAGAAAKIETAGRTIFVSDATGDSATDLASLQNAVSQADAIGYSVTIRPGEAYTIADPWEIGASNLTIFFGEGSSITQSDASKHCIVLDESSPPQYLTLVNPILNGTGYATSTGAGIYGRKTGNTYLVGDLSILGGKITGFQEGIHLRNVVKFYSSRLDLLNNITGYYMDKVDTYLIINTRVTGSTAGGAIANSRCFYFGDQTFGGKVIMGEFGGANIARFCEINGTGVEAIFEGCNLEAFTSPQVSTISATGAATFVFRYGRCAPRAGSVATDAFVSADATGNLQHAIEITGLSDWVAKRNIEYTGGANRGPTIYGEAQTVTHAATAGATATLVVRTMASRRTWTTSYAALPVSSWLAGEIIYFADATATNSDGFLHQPLIKVFNNRSGADERCTMLNELQERILAAAVKGNSVSGTGTIMTAVLPKTMLVSDGESFHLRITGKTAANANNKQVRIKLNGTVLFDTGIFTSSEANWALNFVCMKDGGFEEWDAQFRVADAAVGVSGMVFGSGDTSGPAWYGNGTVAGTFIVETICTAAGDITYRNGKARWSRGVPLLNT